MELFIVVMSVISIGVLIYVPGRLGSSIPNAGEIKRSMNALEELMNMAADF
ncbi:MAG: hypothetical protein ABIH89_05470 [Elusimicrobiota bacterium]